MYIRDEKMSFARAETGRLPASNSECNRKPKAQIEMEEVQRTVRSIGQCLICHEDRNGHFMQLPCNTHLTYFACCHTIANNNMQTESDDAHGSSVVMRLGCSLCGPSSNITVGPTLSELNFANSTFTRWCKEMREVTQLPNPDYVCPFDQCNQSFQQLIPFQEHVRECGRSKFHCKRLKFNGDHCEALFDPTNADHIKNHCHTFGCSVCKSLGGCCIDWTANQVDAHRHTAQTRENTVLRIASRVDLLNELNHAQDQVFTGLLQGVEVAIDKMVQQVLSLHKPGQPVEAAKLDKVSKALERTQSTWRLIPSDTRDDAIAAVTKLNRAVQYSIRDLRMPSQGGNLRRKRILNASLQYMLRRHSVAPFNLPDIADRACRAMRDIERSLHQPLTERLQNHQPSMERIEEQQSALSQLLQQMGSPRAASNVQRQLFVSTADDETMQP